MEETLNALLDVEADRLRNAKCYERSEARRDTRVWHYERKLQTKAGEVSLRILPKPRTQTFETAIIERYRRRESSVEEALIEMCLAGVSVRRVEDITEALWGTRGVAHDAAPDLEQEELRNDRGLAQPAGSRANIPTVISMVSCSSARGRARCATYRSWWRSGSKTRAIGRFSASAKAPKRTKRVEAASSNIRGLHGVRLIISDACMAHLRQCGFTK